ncbi:NmrA/HSCARG family protein [Actinocrispum sp. NPDC049592]|uniref:NmrA/HSCARG family protein n=1 Tax=Actinocrispum sp. NPDC049592 TaxID=3154835 RepID=UPI003444E9EB
MILVTGSTGTQGGATARHLLHRGREVRALVRDVGSPAAKTLESLGATLVAGDMTDRASLDAAMSGVDGVFSVQPAGPDEVAMGLAVADAAAAAGVAHLVYTSVAGVERITGLPSWNTKLQIENHIRSLGIPFTFLRPVKFMDNLRSSLDLETGEIHDLWNPGTPTQVIAGDDIGWFGADAFIDPETHVGQAWELAGDDLSHTQMAAELSETLGRPITYHQDDPDEFAAKRSVPAETIRRAVSLIGDHIWQADIPALRAIHPDLLTFRAWLTHPANPIRTPVAG